MNIQCRKWVTLNHLPSSRPEKAVLHPVLLSWCLSYSSITVSFKLQTWQSNDRPPCFMWSMKPVITSNKKLITGDFNLNLLHGAALRSLLKTCLTSVRPLLNYYPISSSKLRNLFPCLPYTHTLWYLCHTTASSCPRTVMGSVAVLFLLKLITISLVLFTFSRWFITNHSAKSSIIKLQSHYAMEKHVLVYWW